MLEIKNENTDLAVYINGKPKIELIPQEVMDSILAVLIEEFDRYHAEK